MTISWVWRLDDGYFCLGPSRIHWTLRGEFPNYVAFGWGDHQIEFGEIDQGAPGVYLVDCSGGDCTTTKTLLQFQGNQQEDHS